MLKKSSSSYRVLFPAPSLMALLGGLLLVSGCGDRSGTEPSSTGQVAKPAVAVKTIKGDALTVQKIAAIFNEKDYAWPPQESVPLILVDAFPEGMNTLSVSEKKAMFFRILLPIVMHENARVREQRRFLLEVFDDVEGIKPGSKRAQRLTQLMQVYKVEGDWREPAVQQKFLRRVDTVPAGLVLAQAANESAWGTSRFTRAANNIFGQWTYNPAIGLKPKKRDDGAKHFIRVFDNLSASVRAYLRNINMGHAYGDLRQLRAQMRENGKSLDPVELAAGLLRYSQRGEAYVDEIRTLIRSNKLNKLNQRPLVLAQGQ